MNYNLAYPFSQRAISQPDREALWIGERTWNYSELRTLAQRIAAWLLLLRRKGPGRVGILASRSWEAYAGVLGTLWSGAAYVPINPHTPDDRLIRILKTTNLDALVADQAGLDLLSETVLEHAPSRILFRADAKPSQSVVGFRGISLTSMAELPDKGPDQPVVVAEDALAYIIFTSGTTGTPKGVMIEAGSFVQMIDVLQRRYGFRPDDRMSQSYELSFDPSILSMFTAWNAGAALYVVPDRQSVAPGKFIKDNDLTVWGSAPSVAIFMQRIGMLKADAFPRLRYSFFGGEALPMALVKAWQVAAPNSVIENHYGPTEVTVCSTVQRVTNPLNLTPNRGIVAIGDPLEGVEAEILDENLKSTPQTEAGELFLAGRQLARGYLNDPEMTAARFPVLQGKRWYRTGDLVSRGLSGAFHFLGRVDNQVKILGNRVELEEVEAHLRETVGADSVAAVAWPVVDGRASGIVAFYCAPGVICEDVREKMKKRVPSYMVPQRVHCLDELPLGSTGKIDRKALIRLLEENLID